MNTQAINESLWVYLTNHPWIALLMVWTLAWKGFALWKASKNNHLVVFVVLLVLNTVGIAEIIYLAYMYYKARKALTPATPPIPTPKV